jgi:adenylate cyclase
VDGDDHVSVGAKENTCSYKSRLDSSDFGDKFEARLDTFDGVSETEASVAEIERKFLVDRLPQGLGQGASIRQGYVALDDATEVRIRAKGDERTLTIKGGRGIERAEVELDITHVQFEELWELANGRTLTKARHEVPIESGLAEVDIYDGSLAGLVVVEVEFHSMQAAEAFEPPDWFGAELTGDVRYSNARLAIGGAPA